MADQDNPKARPRLVGRPAAGKVPAAQEPAAAPPMGSTSVPAQESAPKRGPGALPARKPPGERAVRVPAPEAKSGKLVKMIMLLIVFGGIPLLVVAGFVVRKNEHPLWYHLLNQMGMMKLEKAKPSKAAETASTLDLKYTKAIIARGRAERYINQEVGDARLQFATLEGARADEIAKKLQGFQEEITASLEDINAVVEETRKPEGASASKVDPVTAGRELSSQTQFSKDLLALSTEWKGIADIKSGRVVAAAVVKRPGGPRKSVVEERKPDPDAPKEPEKPKPAEPEKAKPEPAKPEPAKPAEPEKPKPAEPEKPKPAEPEKPKPEPAKPAEPEKPKPEPAKPVEPEKPKPAEPEKPKVPAKTPVQLVAEADQLIAEGNPLALEVVKGSRPMPEAADKRKDLGIQCETAMAFFTKAKGILEGLKEAVPVGDKLAKVEKVLGILQNVQDGLRSK